MTNDELYRMQMTLLAKSNLQSRQIAKSSIRIEGGKAINGELVQSFTRRATVDNAKARRRARRLAQFGV